MMPYGGHHRGLPFCPVPGVKPPSSRRMVATDYKGEAENRVQSEEEEFEETTISVDSHPKVHDSSATYQTQRKSNSESPPQLKARKSSTSSSSSSIREYKKKYEMAIQNKNYSKRASHSSRESSSSNFSHRSDASGKSNSSTDRGKAESFRSYSTDTSEIDSEAIQKVSAASKMDYENECTTPSLKTGEHAEVIGHGTKSGHRSSNVERQTENRQTCEQAKSIHQYRVTRSRKERDRVSESISQHCLARTSREDRSVATKSSRESSMGGSATSGINGKEIGEVSKRKSSIQSDRDGRSVASIMQTIALLGGSGLTGSRFLHAALNAGYQVQCLPSDDPRQTSVKHQPWKILQAEMEDTQQLEILVTGATHVVVMVNDLLPKKNADYPSLFLTRLVGKLYALMRRENNMRVFLFQATSLASNVEGQTPMLSKVVKTTTKWGDRFMHDLDSVIKKIATEHGLRPRGDKNDENKDPNPTQPNFSFLVTRPTILLQNGPGCKRLFASKSQPGPVPISHIDLAEFTLNALTTKKLYNSSPYVVADCF